MPPSIREQILEAIVAALQAGGGPAGLSVHRSRARPLSKDQLPAQVVYPIQERTVVQGAKFAPAPYLGKPQQVLVRHTMAIIVEHRVIGDPPDVALEPLLVWATAQLLADPQWGTLAISTEEHETKWAASEEDATYGAAAQEFHIDYFSLAVDPTSGNR